MSIPLTIVIAGLLLLFGAIFSGLNIGLMMVRPAELKRKAAHGDKVAAQLYRYRKDANYLLVCILLGGTAVVSALSLVLESVAGGILAGLITTLLVTVFGEIVPQTVFVRQGYTFSRYFFWLLNLVFFLFYPIAKPLSLLLDRVLGKELPIIFTREEISHIVDEHAQEHSRHSGIDIDESRIVRGALAYGQAEASQIMTPIAEVNVIDSEEEVDVPLLIRLKKSGHSRFPIHNNETGEYVGILYMKDLLAEELPQPVQHMYRDKLFDIPHDAPLDTVLSRFIQTKSHLFLVRQDTDGDGADAGDKVIGIITLEDVIEKILGREIEDEFDPESR